MRHPLISTAVSAMIVSTHLMAEETSTTPPGKPSPAEQPADAAKENPGELQAALEKLELPGIKINVKEWSVDVDAEISQQSGLLELIACTKDTKEHESILMVKAKPSHIHTALLLLGAQPGNPATQRVIEGDEPRFVHLPPRGHPVDIHLVFEEDASKEHPINEFIVAADHHDANVEPKKPGEDEKFHTHTFVFAGSVLYSDGDGPKIYVADQSGSVISLATFGDELLCLPGFHDNANEALAWQANGNKLPEIGTKVTLRLRPQRKNQP
ncbi:MAG: YdjY domain-containing protein [Luteolibacter sp.]